MNDYVGRKYHEVSGCSRLTSKMIPIHGNIPQTLAKPRLSCSSASRGGSGWVCDVHNNGLAGRPVGRTTTGRRGFNSTFTLNDKSSTTQKCLQTNVQLILHTGVSHNQTGAKRRYLENGPAIQYRLSGQKGGTVLRNLQNSRESRYLKRRRALTDDTSVAWGTVYLLGEDLMRKVNFAERRV